MSSQAQVFFHVDDTTDALFEWSTASVIDVLEAFYLPLLSFFSTLHLSESTFTLKTFHSSAPILTSYQAISDFVHTD